MDGEYSLRGIASNAGTWPHFENDLRPYPTGMRKTKNVQKKKRQVQTKANKTKRPTVSDEEIVSLWDLGESMTDIGNRFGLSRERIRQRLLRNDISGRNPNCPYEAEELLRVVRSAGNWADAVAQLHTSKQGLRQWLETTGSVKAAERELANAREAKREKSYEAARQRIVKKLKELAVKCGETPPQHVLESHGIYTGTFIRYFDSTSAAMKAAGLKPRRQKTK